ncbi:AAA family ATPase [Peribacillus sp. SCS-155]|uniref:AAA family ATPase n=1 Tax=Peribacillus sedimenti TaxID=3115297 RepID=UPI003905A9D9
MQRKVPEKIHIIGSVGSGKTTLAKALSSSYDIPYYELDNVVWKRFDNGDVRRTDEERDQYLRTIIESKSWIVEGVHFSWVSQSFSKADLIIFLDTNYSTRKLRIIKRFILQKIRFEKANYKPSFKMFKRMFGWNADFENIYKPEIKNMLQIHNDKLLILKDNTEIDNYFITELDR